MSAKTKMPASGASLVEIEGPYDPSQPEDWRRAPVRPEARRLIFIPTYILFADGPALVMPASLTSVLPRS